MSMPRQRPDIVILTSFHKTSALEFCDVPADQKPDIFGPFIRVTNSFNGLRALGFDIGFYRKVCKNGLILPQTIIWFKFSHSHQEIGQTLQFLVEKDRLSQFKNAFTQSMAALRTCAVDRIQFDRLVLAVLRINPPVSKPRVRVSLALKVKIARHRTKCTQSGKCSRSTCQK